LRQRGYSLPEIHKKVDVGYGSVFRYSQGVKILQRYQKEWRKKQGGSIKRMINKEKLAEQKAKKTITTLTNRERLIFITALYWGEGSKSDFNLMNTDADLIKVFLQGLREIFNISNDRIRISIRIYEDLDKQRCLNYWSKITGISTSEFVSVNVLKGKKKGKLQYGMCRLRVLKGGDMLKYIKALKKRVVSII